LSRIPIACLLDDGARHSQLAAWTELVRNSCRALTPIERGVEVRFAPEAREEVERLVATERDCCGWAEWTVIASDDEVVLTASSAEDPGPEVLQGIFASAR